MSPAKLGRCCLLSHHFHDEVHADLLAYPLADTLPTRLIDQQHLAHGSRRDPIDGDVALAGDALFGGEQLLQVRDLPPPTGEPVEGERGSGAERDGQAHKHRHRHLQAVVR